MITYYLANRLLNFLGRGESVNVSGNSRYVALSQTLPNHAYETQGTDDTGVTEPSGGGYARVALALYGQSYSYEMTQANDGEITNGTPGSTGTNSGDIVYFPEVTGTAGDHPWGTLKWFCIFDSQTGGNLLAFAPICDENGQPLENGITPEVGQLPIIRKGQLRISIDKEEPESGE